MRLWSIHPQYLDSKGLVACWRESLLAQKVLLGQTKGYKNHPQLERFKNFKIANHSYALVGISEYLHGLVSEAKDRGYNFNEDKIIKTTGPRPSLPLMEVTTGQLYFEFRHLLNKLKLRDIVRYLRICKKLNYREGSNYFYLDIDKIEPHPLFTVVDGTKESWEK